MGRDNLTTLPYGRIGIIRKLKPLLSSQTDISIETLFLLTNQSVGDLEKLFLDEECENDDLYLRIQIYAYVFFGRELFMDVAKKFGNQSEVLAIRAEHKQQQAFIQNLFFFTALRMENHLGGSPDLDILRDYFSSFFKFARDQVNRHFETRDLKVHDSLVDKVTSIPLENRVQDLKATVIDSYFSRDSTIALFEETMKPILGDRTTETVTKLRGRNWKK